MGKIVIYIGYVFDVEEAELSMPEIKPARKRLADDFDEYAREKTKSWNFEIRFDYDRIREVQEGWIPVVLNGKLDSFEDYTFDNAKGVIHNGNCD